MDDDLTMLDVAGSSPFQDSVIAATAVSDVPQSFNDSWFTGNVPSPQGMDNNIAPDAPGFFNSQSDITNGDIPNVNLPGAQSLTNGFLDTATKLLAQLRGNTGQDRNAATGRARPQKSVADLLGLGSVGSGTMNASAPGTQGMFMIVLLGVMFLVIAMFAGKR
jgi:hypothetical protein